MKNQNQSAELTMELYNSPNREKNRDKYGFLTNQCICCMKPISNIDSEILYVHMNTYWLAVNPTIVTEENCVELTGYDSQGCFPVGNDCAKKMKGFTFKIK